MKSSRDLLPSAARTASTATARQTDRHATAVRLYLDVTVASGRGGLSVVIRGWDKLSGRSVELTTGGDPVTQVGTYAYEMSLAPDPAFGALREAVSRNIPFQWDAIVKHIDGSSYTYSLGCEIVDSSPAA